MARPSKCRCICSKPKNTCFMPVIGTNGTITIGFDEYETVRLLDYVGLTQEQCSKKMAVSRTTVTRMYDAARRKIAAALVEGRRIEITGGDVIVCTALKPECVNEPHCCHRSEPTRQGEVL